MDYSLPVRLFLAGAVQRYRFVRLLDLCHSIPLLIVLAVTGGFSVVESLIPYLFGESETVNVLGGYGAFFAAVCW
jgi:hypothetical protein